MFHKKLDVHVDYDITKSDVVKSHDYFVCHVLLIAHNWAGVKITAIQGVVLPTTLLYNCHLCTDNFLLSPKVIRED